MTDFSKAVTNCIADWGKRTADCNGSTECIERCARELRGCLDSAFPDSQKVVLESDKVNYMLSSVFFLANRLSKACHGLAEFDRLMISVENAGVTSLDSKANNQAYSKFHKELDEILARYF